MSALNLHRSLVTGCVALLSLSVLSCAQVFADDTEIFFADQLSTQETTANVLFMFDTSGSMDSTDSGSAARLTRLKEAMISVVNSSENINIGIGSFAGGNRGSIQLPAVGVDEDLCANATCNSIKLRGEILHNDDDAEGYPDGNVDLNGFALNVQNPVSASTTAVSLWALRFDDLNIPRGAIINSATLQLIPREEFWGTSNLDIFAEATDDSLPLMAVNSNLANRTAPGVRTVQQVNWAVPNWPNRNFDRQSPEIGAVISEITDRPGWCGGNALTLLITSQGDDLAAHTRDNDPYRAPVLQIDYDPSSVDWSDSCVRTKKITSIAHGTHDVFEDIGSGLMDADSDRVRTHVAGSAQTIGLRFTDVQIPANAQITKAYIDLPLDSAVAGNVGLLIQAEDTSYSAAIDSSQVQALTSRNYLTEDVQWQNVPESGGSAQSADVSSLVSNLISKAGWAGGGAMLFTMTPMPGSTGERFFNSVDSPSGAGARLVVHYQQDSSDLQNTAPVLKTGRDEMIRTMLDYEHDGGTPLVDAYYEAAQYMRGGAVQYGIATDTGNYENPEFGECKSSQIVLLSDGQATGNSSKDLIRTLVGGTADTSADGSVTDICATRDLESEECGIELARWMFDTDHAPLINGEQNVITHTIGFNISSPFLSDLANAGGGAFYEASSASELTSVFKNIIQSAITQDTGFVAPSSAISLTNRLVNSNELYFALFKPSTSTLWDGNLKRFELAANTSSGELEIVDSFGLPALEINGTIKDSAKSFWSANTDGGNVAKGGAASRLELTRKLFTSFYDNTLSKTTLRTFHENNADINLERLGIQGQSTGYRTELLQWARGVDIKDYDGDSDITEVRAQMGDPMHSSQHIMYYPSNDAADPAARSVLFVGTNHGFLHAINTADGTEEFAYIPEDLLSNLNYFYRDAPANHDERPYGLDGEVSGWHDDANDNGLVDGDEKAYIYVGMRRGGRNYYALDVSDPEAPKFAWKRKIAGGVDTDFLELGQTWSRPVKAKVKYLSTIRDVLFFAGGYDDINDDELLQGPDIRGRAIFMVDAATGELLSSRDSSDFGEMIYSIPSDLRVIDPDGDTLSDIIFVGDTGGQVWRFDINHDADNDGDFISGAVIARFGGSQLAQNRKFFYEPDIALIKDPEGGMFLNIAIGSGSRPNPNSRHVEDSFYSFRDRNIYGPSRNADEEIYYPAPLTESSLVNASQVLGSSDDSGKLATGWFLRLPDIGEKSLSAALTVDNTLMFTTYVPPTTTENSCTASIGDGRVYVVDVLNGNPAGSSKILTDRYTQLQQPGIPPRVSGLIVDAAPNTVSTMVGMEAVGGSGESQEFRRIFWAEQ